MLIAISVIPWTKIRLVVIGIAGIMLFCQLAMPFPTNGMAAQPSSTAAVDVIASSDLVAAMPERGSGDGEGCSVHEAVPPQLPYPAAGQLMPIFGQVWDSTGEDSCAAFPTLPPRINSQVLLQVFRF
jgi:hypothetical protein